MSFSSPNLLEVEGDQISASTVLSLPSIANCSCSWFDSQQTFIAQKLSRRFQCTQLLGPGGNGSMTVTISNPSQTFGPFATLDDNTPTD